MTTGASRTCGFVLSGGGAYAAYEVGVLRALVAGASSATGYEPIDAEVVSGTSAGSVNAALFAAAPWDDAVRAVEQLEDAWVNHLADAPGACGSNVLRLRANPLNLINPSCVFGNVRYYADLAEDVGYLTQETVTRGMMVAQSTGTLRQRLLEAFDLGTLITGDPLRELLHQLVDFARVRRSPRAVRIAATNWRTGELRVFRNEEMTDTVGVEVLLASSAIPGVFRSVEIDNDPYVDGGVVMNTPLRPAIQAGATNLHVVYMDPDVRQIALPRQRNTLNTLYRLIVISFGLTVSRDIRTAAIINRRLRQDERAAGRTVLTGEPRERKYRPVNVHRYFPMDDLGGTFRWLDFDQDHIVRLIQRGFDDAREHDCVRNRCVLADRDDELATTEWGRHDA